MQYVLSSIVVFVVGCVIYYMGFFVPSSIEAHKERNQEIIEKKIPLLKLVYSLREASDKEVVKREIDTLISKHPDLKKFESLKEIQKDLEFEQVKKTLDNLEEVSSNEGVDFSEFNIFAWVGWLFTAGFIFSVIFCMGIIFASGTFLCICNC